MTFRGNERRNIFSDSRDRQALLDRLAERVERYQIRLYLYCLMSNHVHLLLETPKANLSAFMGSLLTSYTNYFNARHRRSGHLMQGRFKSPLVEGDEYLLRLSRYIHLNPVCVEEWMNGGLQARVGLLRSYRWSSYRGYVGLEPQASWIQEGPVLGLMEGKERGRRRRYAAYVEGGMAGTDEEMVALARNAAAIGSEGFRRETRSLMEREGQKRLKREDVAFRRIGAGVDPERIIRKVCERYGIGDDELRRQRKGGWEKAVAAELLVRHGGWSQRKIAERLGVTTGAAICMQLRRLRRNAPARVQNILQDLDQYLTFKG